MSKVKKVRVPATTNNITKAIINLLNYEGHIADRMNRTGVFDPTTNRFRRTTSKRAYLDINATLRPVGLSLWIDVKKGNDKLSNEQEKFIDDIISAGGLAFTVSNYDQFLIFYAFEVWPRISANGRLKSESHTKYLELKNLVL